MIMKGFFLLCMCFLLPSFHLFQFLQKRRKVIVFSTFAASTFAILTLLVSRQIYLPGDLATSKTWFYIFLILFSFCSLPMFAIIFAHTNDFISKDKFVAAGASLQFAFGLGAISGPFL